MSSNVEPVVKGILLNNYISLIGVVIVGYDYILTLSREIDYVWRRKWSWVSTVFVIVRYPGLCWAMLGGLIGTSFIPGPVKTCKHTSYSPAQHQYMKNGSEGTVLFLVSCWTFPVFICAADLVMILRVYTMWHRSRTILYVLVFIYVLQIVVSVVLPAIYNSSTAYFTASIVHVLGFSFCGGTFGPGVPVLLGVYCALPRFALSATLLILAITRTLKQLVDMYNATKQWQPNRYMNQFTRDGIFYFFINTLYNVLVTASAGATTAAPPILINVLIMLASSLLCCTMPRFIISVRELYDRDLRHRRQGIDTGFGVSGAKGLGSSIAFADVAQGESTDRTLQWGMDDENEGAIPLGAIGNGVHEV